MMNDRLTHVLISVLWAFVSTADGGHISLPECRLDSSLGTPSIAPGREFAELTGACISCKGMGALDDEVEVPDESEDDQPDDPGSVIHQKGRSSQVLQSHIDTSIASLVPTSRPAHCDCDPTNPA